MIFNIDAARVGMLILLCFCSTKADIMTIAKVNVFSELIIIGLILYFLQTGFLTDEMHSASGAIEETRERHSMGVGYNRFSLIIFAVLINLYILLYNKIHTVFIIIILSVIPYIVFIHTGSQTAFIGALSLMLFHIIFNNSILKKIFEKKVFLYPFPLFLLVLTLAGAFLYPMFPKLDEWLTHRPFFILKYLSTISPTAFILGDAKHLKIGDSSSIDYITVDSAHIHLLFEAGIVIYIFFYSIYYKTIKYHFIKRSQNKNYNSYTLPVILSVLVLGLSEDMIFSIALIGYAIFWVILFNNAKAYDTIRFSARKTDTK